MSYDSRPDTWLHIHVVRSYLNLVVHNLLTRAHWHDQTKLYPPEVEVFDRFTPKLRNTEYNSPAYKQFLKEMGPALEHHYAHNRHHPEFHEEGVQGMTLLDLTEMLCDWLAATARHEDGDIFKSLEQNQQRYGYSDELKQVFLNTLHQDLLPEEE